MNFLTFFAILVSIVLLDMAWISVMFNRFFEPNIGHLFRHSMQYLPGILFYPLYAIGINVFVVDPGLRDQSTYLHIFFLGLLFGLVAYGTYDLTNQSTLKDWPWIQTVVDMIWGGFLTGVVSVIAAYVARYF